MIVIPKEGNFEENDCIPSNSENKEALKCEHFSIRGYVAETRKKNWEIGWPFPPTDENEGLEGQIPNMLPPLDVPKFRYWACQKCVQTSNASANAEDVPSLVLETVSFGMRDAANGSEDCPIVHCDSMENEAQTSDIGQDVVSFQKRHFRPYESSDDDDEDAHNLIDQGRADRLGDPSQLTSSKRPQKIRLLSEILREKNSNDSAELSNSKQGTDFGDVSTKTNRSNAPYQPDRLALCDRPHVENGIEKKSKKRKTLHVEDHNLFPKRCSKSLGKSRFYPKDQAENGFSYSDGLYRNGESRYPENGNHRKVSQNHIDDIETLSEDRYIESWQGFANGGANHKIMCKGKEIEHVEVPTIQWGLTNKRGSLEKISASDKQKNTHQIKAGACPMRSKDVPFLSNSEKRKNLNPTEAAKNQSKDRAKKTGESEALDDISLEIVELLAKNRHERRCQENQNTDQVMLSVSKKNMNMRDSENVTQVPRKNLKRIAETSKRNSLDKKQMVQSLDKKVSLASSSFYPPMELQGLNRVSREIQRENYLGEHREIISEQACACAQKQSTSTYMPATELLQLMDAGMCPRVPRRESPNQLLLPLTPRTEMDLSREKLFNRPNRDHINLGMYCHPSPPIMYHIGSPVQRHGNSTLRIKESEKIVPETDELSRKGKAKASHSRKHDPFSTKSVPSNLGSLSLEAHLTNDPYTSVGVGDKLAIQHLNWNFGIEMCSVNRNPADFTIPGPRNRFMIGPRELKMEKAVSKCGRPRKIITEAPNPHRQ